MKILRAVADDGAPAFTIKQPADKNNFTRFEIFDSPGKTVDWVLIVFDKTRK